MLVFKEEALEEIRAAHEWYEERVPGLGDRFRRDLHDSLRFVEKHKPGYRIRKDPFRAVVLKKFPFVVWYAVEGGAIVIYRVRHGRQRPLGRFSEE